MATKFPKFSQALAQDPATRRIWYGIATAHDLEAHDFRLRKDFDTNQKPLFYHCIVYFLYTLLPTFINQILLLIRSLSIYYFVR